MSFKIQDYYVIHQEGKSRDAILRKRYLFAGDRGISPSPCNMMSLGLSPGGEISSSSASPGGGASVVGWTTSRLD